MCIIAFIPAASPRPSTETLRTCWTNNPDGAGFMYPHNGQLHVVKGLMTFDDFITAWELIPSGVMVAVHFRIRSHGAKNADMTHPFYINNDNTMALVHNGVLSHGLGHGTDGKSDTAEFAEMLKDMPAGWESSVTACTLVREYIGAHNKMVLMTADARFLILNQSAGDLTADKVWYSNTSYKSARVKAVYSTTGWSYEADDGPTYSNGRYVKPFRQTTLQEIEDLLKTGTDITNLNIRVAPKAAGGWATVPEGGQYLMCVQGYVTYNDRGLVTRWKYDIDSRSYIATHRWKAVECPIDIAEALDYPDEILSKWPTERIPAETLVTSPVADTPSDDELDNLMTLGV